MEPWDFRKDHQLEKLALKTDNADTGPTVYEQNVRELLTGRPEARDSWQQNTAKSGVRDSIQEHLSIIPNTGASPEHKVGDSSILTFPESISMTSIEDRNIKYQKGESSRSAPIGLQDMVGAVARDPNTVPKPTEHNTNPRRMPTPKDRAIGTTAKNLKPRAVEKQTTDGPIPTFVGPGEMKNQPAMQALTKKFQEMREECEAGIKELQDEAKEMIELVSISTATGTSESLLIHSTIGV